MALYRKYRSKKLSEIVGQEHITKTLDNSLKSGRISHAYLFTGPRGVGKTSIARILAHEVNKLPYSDESIHLDIIEIDAASNRGIEDARSLREKIHVAPTSAKYKVYIIDEVHMLTTPAFNALLKTLEEPPEHAIFILATTEAHKLPETIISRTQRFSFKPIDETKAVEHLKSIAKSEGIKASDDALKLIVEHGAGSFRDSISLLDQASSHTKTIELKDVQALLGIAPAAVIADLYKTVLGGSPNQLLSTLARLRDDGYSAPSLAKQLSSRIRSSIVGADQTANHSLVDLLEDLLKIPAANDPDSLLEIILLGANLKLSTGTEAATEPSGDDSPPHEPTLPVDKPPKPPKEPIQKSEKPKKEPAAKAADEPDEAAVSELNESWQKVLDELKSKHNTLYGILRMAKPELAGKKLRLGFRFPFHQKRLDESRNKDIVSAVVKDVFGRPLTLDCTIVKDAEPFEEPAPAEAPKNIDTISNIFGGAEVL